MAADTPAWAAEMLMRMGELLEREDTEGDVEERALVKAIADCAREKAKAEYLDMRVQELTKECARLTTALAKAQAEAAAASATAKAVQAKPAVLPAEWKDLVLDIQRSGDDLTRRVVVSQGAK